MESFRKLIKGWLGIVLLVLFLIPLALVGIEGYFSGSNKGDVAKKVNGQAISNKELDELVKSYQQQYLQYVQGDESLLNTGVIRESALNTLIARTLLLQQAGKLGIQMSDTQFVQMLSQLPDFQVNGKFSNEVFGNYLRSRGITKEALLANLQQDHALKMLTATASSYALTSKQGVENFVNLQSEQRELYLSSIKLDEYKKGITISNQDVADYYEKHKAEFRRSASVDVDYVVVKPSMFTQTAPITDAELQQAYTQYVDAQKNNALKKVRHILITKDTRSDADALKLANDVEAKIKAGLSFADAAKQFSEDPTSKLQGGLIQDYQAGTLGSTEFDDAVKALKDNTISAPVKTNFGYHIIDVKTDAVKVVPFEQEKAALQASLEKSKLANVYTDTVNSLNDAAVNADALDVITQQVKTASIQSAKNVTLWTSNTYLSQPVVKAKLFNDDVKNGDHNISTSIALANGETLWLKIRRYYPEGLQTLEQATDAIKATLLNKKAAAIATAKIAATLEAFKTQPAAEVLAKSAIKFEKPALFSRQNLKKDIADVAFTQPIPKAGMWSVGTADLSDELVIVAVSKVDRDAFTKLTPEQVQQATKAYQQLHGEQELADYIDYLKSVAKIK
ncbi:SurA N-terminal domain-containing protein [Acinetobacter rathckeae]|uniref:SurA N-terminal domain-containing protein n=1 Tax=Acinetobacter rathckeae TaxID=2605272 RepID=UPI0018A2C10B|nr:SurA N-terminal domain-containing protein [Acinetobacter rathckeae]MBF7694454.1 SurA N-terminal domain-containing protein [Acinetobacter rathckeae]